ncbi:predicted protein [Chaetoceros tenuissimus]|uniref:Uncharacterized protein n=1 Tax=Chaetoceros tenuissimus TaxID=426638 RepID=A0AAD3GZJ6_9STRA|nr:predicted protein [Chaetoceros tenuissimus]
MHRIISLSWALLAAAFTLLISHEVTVEATRISISSPMDGDHAIKNQLPQRIEEHATPSTMPSIVYEWDTNEERFVMVGLVDTDTQMEESKTQRTHVIHEESLVHDLQEERNKVDQGLHGTLKRLQALFRK